MRRGWPHTGTLRRSAQPPTPDVPFGSDTCYLVTFGVRAAEAPIGSYALLARHVRQSRANAVERAVGVNESKLAKPVLRVMRIAEPVR
jgi:hypothetical protein